jgi:hypothetical protein
MKSSPVVKLRPIPAVKLAMQKEKVVGDEW